MLLKIREQSLFNRHINMECFHVCLKMPISKITSVLNAKDVFYYTRYFKHVLRKKHVFLLSYSVLDDLRENLGGRGVGGYTRSARQ